MPLQPLHVVLTLTVLLGRRITGQLVCRAVFRVKVCGKLMVTIPCSSEFPFHHYHAEACASAVLCHHLASY